MPTRPPSNRERGRPSKLTPEVIAALEAGVRVGMSRGDMCAAVGVRVATFDAWMQYGRTGDKGPRGELYKRLMKADAEFRHALKGAVLKAAGDRPAVYDLCRACGGRAPAVNTCEACGGTGRGSLISLPGRRGDWRAAVKLLERSDRFGLLATYGEDADPANEAAPPMVIDAEDIPLDASDAAVLEARVKSLRRQIAAAEAAGNFDAVASLTRHVARAEGDLRAARGSTRTETDPATTAEDDFAAQLELVAAELPDAHAEIIVRAYCARHRLKLVRDTEAVVVSRGDA